MAKSNVCMGLPFYQENPPVKPMRLLHSNEVTQTLKKSLRFQDVGGITAGRGERHKKDREGLPEKSCSLGSDKENGELWAKRPTHLQEEEFHRVNLGIFWNKCDPIVLHSCLRIEASEMFCGFSQH